METATNLVPPIHWTVVASNLLANDGQIEFTDTHAAGSAQKFYRIAR
ncbi:MAG: hypothetical protein N3I86_02220 [Verrucomicrobiae bacterium]|nr:hypothetical protein [Verrucomicrobiae bacterium]